MDHLYSPEALSSAPCDERMEENLYLYLDGELPSDAETMLFSHLAGCPRCRQRFSAVMEFRRVSRLDVVSVPPAVDDRFFQRLDRVRRDGTRRDRYMERRPLWQRRAPISLRSAAAMAVVLFVAGLLWPRPLEERGWSLQGQSPIERHIEAQRPLQVPVFGQDERVELPTSVSPLGEAVYVFYPGLTIEATKLEDRVPSESL